MLVTPEHPKITKRSVAERFFYSFMRDCSFSDVSLLKYITKV